MGKYKASSLVNVSLVLLLFLYGLAFYLNGTLDGSANLQTFVEWIPYDSIQYVEKSEHLSFSDLSMADVATGALNWLSLSFVYKTLNDIGSLGALGFILINCLCFYLMVRLGLTSASTSIRLSQANTNHYPILLFLCSPFLFAWILVPNKELLVTAGILGVIHAIAARRMLLLVVFTLAVGLIKVQIIFATVLYLLSRKFHLRKTMALVGISLIYPLLYNAVPGLQMSHFLDVNPNEIRTAPIMLAIDSLSSYPFGYIAIFLVRLVLNLLGGLNAIRIIESDFGMSGLAPLTSFILGLLVIMSLLFMIKRRDVRNILNSNSDTSYYLFCLLVVHLVLPFMQPRYYWWTIPILLSYIMYGNRPRVSAIHSVPAGFIQGASS